MIIDHTKVKLGRLPVRRDKRTLKLAKYLQLAPPIPATDWSHGITDWGMMGNNFLGDCTCAAVAHAIQTWTANTAGEVTLPDTTVIQAYSDWCGYNPSNPSSDQGGVEVDVLSQWRSSGLAGHSLLAYADPDPKNIVHVQQAIRLYGGVYIGIGLPRTAQNQDVWDVVGNPLVDPDSQIYSWGGHAVFVIAYQNHGETLTCISWGKLITMTKAFWLAYCDESHCLFSRDWLAHFGGNAALITALEADLQAVTG